MGGKRKPAYVLANRDELSKLTYIEKINYREKVLPGIYGRCDKLLAEVVAHLVRMRVKHVVYNKEIMVFDDSDDWSVKRTGLSFHAMFFNWPEVPNNRIRASFFKFQPSDSPTWFRLKKVSVAEPVFGFDTLSLAKSLKEMRAEFIKRRKLANKQQAIRDNSLALAKRLVIPEHKSKQYNIGTSWSSKHPDKFELQITQTVTLAQAAKIIDGLE